MLSPEDQGHSEDAATSCEFRKWRNDPAVHLGLSLAFIQRSLMTVLSLVLPGSAWYSLPSRIHNLSYGTDTQVNENVCIFYNVMLGAAGNNELSLEIARMFPQEGGSWLRGCITQHHDGSFLRTFTSRRGKEKRNFSMCPTLCWDRGSYGMGNLCF